MDPDPARIPTIPRVGRHSTQNKRVTLRIREIKSYQIDSPLKTPLGAVADRVRSVEHRCDEISGDVCEAPSTPTSPAIPGPAPTRAPARQHVVQTPAFRFCPPSGDRSLGVLARARWPELPVFQASRPEFQRHANRLRKGAPFISLLKMAGRSFAPWRRSAARSNRKVATWRPPPRSPLERTQRTMNGISLGRVRPFRRVVPGPIPRRKPAFRPPRQAPQTHF